MPTVLVNQPGIPRNYVHYKDWTRTPGYRGKVVRGEILPENGFTTYTSESNAPIVRIRRNPKNDPTYVQNLSFLNTYGNTHVDARAVLNNNGYFRVPNTALVADHWQEQVIPRGTLEVQAGNKLSKKLNNRDIDLGVALGEARETAQFVQGAMLRTFAAAKRARRGDLSGTLKALGLSKTTDAQKQKLRDVPDAISRAWLGFSYGARPLMNDVLGACKALEKRHERPSLLTYRASELCELDFTIFTTAHVKSPTDFDPDYTMCIKGWHKASDKITFEVDNPILYKLSQLGLTNPLSVAYELITLSFVLDWFIPIGSWIAGIVPPQGVKNVRRVVTWRGDVYYDGKLSYKEGACPIFSHNKWKYRAVKSGFPRYHLVGATFELSKAQVMSGLSLLWSFGASEKSQAKAYNDAVALNSRQYQSIASTANLSREAWSHGKRNVKSASAPGYLFPSSFAHI
jgi:hypothetical protein